jgi:hypothetical protein
MIDVIEAMFPENPVHLVKGAHIRPDMLRILSLEDITRPNFVAPRAEFVCKICADEPTASCYKYLVHGDSIAPFFKVDHQPEISSPPLCHLWPMGRAE